MSRLRLEADQQAKISEEQAHISANMTDALDETISEPLFEISDASAPVTPPTTFTKRKLASLLQGKLSAPSLVKASAAGVVKKKNWESHDVYRAIE